MPDWLHKGIVDFFLVQDLYCHFTPYSISHVFFSVDILVSLLTHSFNGSGFITMFFPFYSQI